MIIKRIELENFRIYKGKNSIDLTSEAGKNIFIISGRNGFGKTTFLMSLVWCLYGRQMNEVDDLYQKEISDQGGYPKYIANSLNRQAKLDGDRTFSVSITITEAIIDEMQCEEITVKRTHNIDQGDSLQIFIDGFENELVKGMAENNQPGEEIFIRDYLMPIEIAKFFFFDAEKIVTLAEVNTVEQRRKLSKAYSEILGIKKYEDLKHNLEEIQIKLRQAAASVKDQTTLNNLRTSVENSTLEIQDKEKSKSDFRDRRDEKRLELSKLQEKLIRAGNLITANELAALKTSEKALEEDIVALQNDLKDYYELVPFAIAGGKLLEVVSQLEEESSFKKAQFKQEEIQRASNKVLTDLLLAQRSFSKVIDGEVHEFYTNTFKKLIRQHFFENAPELPENFQVLHEFSDAERNELRALVNQLKLSFKESFGRISNGYNKSRQELAMVRRRLNAAEANEEDPIIAADRARKEQLEREIVRLEDDMTSIDREIGQIQEQQKAKQRQYSELAKRLEAAEVDREKDGRLTRHINQLRQFISRFQDNKKKSLEHEILTGLKTLMHKKGFVQGVDVKILGEDIDINLLNKAGQIIPKESLSKGEQQMYATALLRGLVEESRIEFPVFIDSPMQKFDEQHAENIIRFFYPNIADQVILFPLVNKEMNSKEYNLLLPRIARTYLINNEQAEQSRFLEVAPKQFLSTYNRLYNNE